MEKVDGYITIKNDKHFSIDDLHQYLIDSDKIGKIDALHKLLIKSLNLASNTILTSESASKYLNSILKNEEWIDKYYNKNLNIYNSFYNAVHKGIDNLSYSEAITNITKSLSTLSSTLVNIVKISYENIINNESLNSLRKLAQTLASIHYDSEEIKLVDKNVEKLIEYGWPVSFELEDYVFEKIPGKAKTNEIVKKYYTKQRISKIERTIRDYLKFDKYLMKYFKEAKKDFLNCSYYSCAVMLFAIIDRLISMNFSNEIGIKGILLLKKKLKDVEFYNGYVNYSTVKVLFKLYADTNNFTLDKSQLNRNMIDHGWAKRNINPYECLQLLLIINNILFILNNETNIMSETLKIA